MDYCNELCVRRLNPNVTCPVCEAWKPINRLWCLFAWLWFGVKLVLVLCVVFLCWVVGRPAVGVLYVLGQWVDAWWDRLRSRQGYTIAFTIVGAYFGAYAIIEARHERQLNRALFGPIPTFVSPGAK